METSRERVATLGRAAGIAAIAWLGWIAYVRGERVPLLAGVDLGFHELGHMLMAWAPSQVAALAGTVMQIAVPLGLAAYFIAARHEEVAGALMLGWAGTSAQSASVYIADAPFQRLPLIGGTHDWAYLLGPAWNVMGAAGAIAGTVWVLGLLMLGAGLGLCVAGIVRERVRVARAEAEAARLATLPVREPSNRPPAVRLPGVPPVPEEPAPGAAPSA